VQPFIEALRVCDPVLKQTRLLSALNGLATIRLVGLMFLRALGFWSGMASMVILTFDYLMLSLTDPVPKAGQLRFRIIVVLYSVTLHIHHSQLG
jgi:hypothetical protein